MVSLTRLSSIKRNSLIEFPVCLLLPVCLKRFLTFCGTLVVTMGIAPVLPELKTTLPASCSTVENAQNNPRQSNMSEFMWPFVNLHHILPKWFTSAHSSREVPQFHYTSMTPVTSQFVVRFICSVFVSQQLRTRVQCFLRTNCIRLA